MPLHPTKAPELEMKSNIDLQINTVTILGTQDKLLHINRTGEPAMLIGSDGIGRFVRPRRNAAMYTFSTLVYLNAAKYQIDNPFDKAMSRLVTFYEHSLALMKAGKKK